MQRLFYNFSFIHFILITTFLLGCNGFDSNSKGGSNRDPLKSPSTPPNTSGNTAPITPAPPPVLPPPPSEPVTPNPIIYQTISFSASQENWPNPERGFYDRIDLDSMTSNLLTTYRDKGTSNYPYPLRLIYSQVEISQFRNQDFTSAFLVNFENRLKLVRASGLKLILRFVYDDSETGLDASASQIQRHLEQLKPILQSYDDTIAFFQAGFIGAWGEWHSSRSGNSFGYNAVPGITEAEADARRLQIKNALVSNVPTTIPLGFRYPLDLIKWAQNKPESISFGLINDCWMAGPDDMGTYGSNSERTFIKTLTISNPFGGETCSSPGTVLRNSCVDVLKEGKEYHLTYLNAGYSSDFTTRWKNEGCFITVAQQMGHRISLASFRYPMSSVRPGDKAEFQLEMINSGWSKLFKRRFVTLHLKSSSGALVSFETPISLDSLPSQMSSSQLFKFTIQIPASMASGNYAIGLSAPDDSLNKKGEKALAQNEFNSLRFINADLPVSGQSWDKATNIFYTGTTLKVSP